MIYRVLYNDGSLGCTIFDPDVVYQFARFMTSKGTFNRYPVCILKIKLK